MSEMISKVQQIVADAMNRIRYAIGTFHEKELLEDFELIESHHAWLRSEFTALTQRAEQAEAEVKRLREGIEEIVYVYSDYRAVLEQPHKLIADLTALLAQPSDGKE